MDKITSMKKGGYTEQPHSYETLDFSNIMDIALPTKKSNESKIDTCKSKQMMCQIIIKTITVIVVIGLSASLGVALTSKSHAESLALVCNNTDLWDTAQNNHTTTPTQFTTTPTQFTTTPTHTTSTPTRPTISCGLPPIPQNGSISFINGVEIQATASFRCDDGFLLQGNNEIYCTNQGFWTSAPTCILKDCGVPPNIQNALIKDLGATTFNKTFSVTCNDGYTRSGPSTVRCASDGNWTCLPTCEPLPRPPSRFCSTNSNWLDLTPTTDIDCSAIRKRGITTTGIYIVSLQRTKTVCQVFCDMDTDNGGWTVFQNRFTGTVDFYQNFSTYEGGFGYLNGEFWLGLRYIQEMARVSQTELRVDMTAADGSKAYMVFRNFSLTIGPDYTLNFDTRGYGTAVGNADLTHNEGIPFSAFDRDVDGSSRNCGEYVRGGWWYANCAWANLNGEYLPPGTNTTGSQRGMTYHSFKRYESLKTSKMMFRRMN